MVVKHMFSLDVNRFRGKRSDEEGRVRFESVKDVCLKCCKIDESFDV